jgi:hypothetical protein
MKKITLLAGIGQGVVISWIWEGRFGAAMG